MRDQKLETQVRFHTIRHLPEYLADWDALLHLMTPAHPAGGEHLLVHLAGVVQRSRTFSRLLGDEHAETASVALETLLTLLLEGDLLYAENYRKIVIESSRTLFSALAARLATPVSDESSLTKDPLSGRKMVETVYRLLDAIGDMTAASAYGGPCVAFPVRHKGRDGAPLRLRGFDLYRIEMEDLRLFMLEISWKDITDRPTGLIGMLDSASRNGHVFDIRPACAFQPPCDPSLRLLYGSNLDPDFLEILLQTSVERIHLVNPVLVRRYRPSWGFNTGKGNAPARVHSSKFHKSIEDLVKEYTVALNKMFATARTAPRDENLPDNLL